MFYWDYFNLWQTKKLEATLFLDSFELYFWFFSFHAIQPKTVRTMNNQENKTHLIVLSNYKKRVEKITCGLSKLRTFIFWNLLCRRQYFFCSVKLLFNSFNGQYKNIYKFRSHWKIGKNSLVYTRVQYNFKNHTGVCFG